MDFAMMPEERVQKAKETLARVVAMLIAMIRSLESQHHADMGG